MIETVHGRFALYLTTPVSHTVSPYIEASCFLVRIHAYYEECGWSKGIALLLLAFKCKVFLPTKDRLLKNTYKSWF